MFLVIILIIICLVLLLRPNNAAAQAIEHGGPQGGAGCASLALWIIGAALLMAVLTPLLLGKIH